MCAVHASRGPLEPAVAAPALRGRRSSAGSPRPRSGDRRHGIAVGATAATTTRVIRTHIAQVVPGCDAYDEKVDQPGRLRAAAPAARHPRPSTTESGRAEFTRQPARGARGAGGPPAAADAAQPRPVQHHDLRPRRPLPRASTGGRRVVFVHPDDLAALGLARRRAWSTSSASGRDGSERRRPRLPRRRLRPRRAGAPPPTTRRRNLLVPLDSTADGSNSPTSKSVVVRLEPPGTTSSHDAHGGVKAGSDHTRRSDVEPTHLS